MFAAEVQKKLDELLTKTVKPEQLTYFVTDVEEFRGQVAALSEIEENFSDIKTAAAVCGWTADQILVYKLQAVLRTAAAAGGKGLRFSDDTSGRGNDNRRSYRDGWFNIVDLVQRDLNCEVNNLYATVNV